MIYSLHPEAAQELEDAFNFYREQGGNGLARAFLAEILTIDIRGVRSAQPGSRPLYRLGGTSSKRFKWLVVHVVLADKTIRPRNNLGVDELG